jgi:hypothetical protein
MLASIATARQSARTAGHQADGFIDRPRDMTAFSLIRLHTDVIAVR